MSDKNKKEEKKEKPFDYVAYRDIELKELRDKEEAKKK